MTVMTVVMILNIFYEIIFHEGNVIIKIYINDFDMYHYYDRYTSMTVMIVMTVMTVMILNLNLRIIYRILYH